MSENQQLDILDLASARKMVGEILLSQPGNRFGGPFDDTQVCQYFEPGGEPCCVIGHVFARIGIGPADLTGASDVASNTAKFVVLSETWEDKITDKAAAFLRDVQDAQDDGKTWAEVHGMFFGEAEEDEAAS